MIRSVARATMSSQDGHIRTKDYLRRLGVPDVPPAITPMDPGYDPVTLESHLEQSAHLMSGLKISMACWLVAAEATTRRKVAAARAHAVSTVTGGGPFEVAATQGQLPAYLDLCADIGFDAVECGEGFTTLGLSPEDVAAMTTERGLAFEFELGKKHDGAFSGDGVAELIDSGRRWLDVGARRLIVEARESAQEVGLFDAGGRLNAGFAERFVAAFGFERVVFEAPNKASQFALIEHFGPEVRLANVRLEEILRVEIYRRGLHSDAFETAPWRLPATSPTGA